MVLTSTDRDKGHVALQILMDTQGQVVLPTPERGTGEVILLSADKD